MDQGPSPLYVETRHDGSILLRGELDISTLGQLDEAVVTTPGRPVVIDMAQLTYIDSSGIGFLVQATKQQASGSSSATPHVRSAGSWT